MSLCVLTAELLHESNSFNSTPTSLKDFQDRSLLFGQEAIDVRSNCNTEIAGFLDVGREHGWTITHVLSAHAQPSGRVTRAAYEALVGPIIAAATVASANGALDGILLALHGAMLVEDCDDGEGELLRRLRAVVGLELPIAITLDPHCNCSQAMCDLSQIIVAYKTYPHVDMRVTARQAAQILHKTMSRSECRPFTFKAWRPLLEEINGGRTDAGDMLPRIIKARQYEEEMDDVYAVSVNGGFANADIKDVGPTILVTCDRSAQEGDQGRSLDRHVSFAEELADDMWRCRFAPLNVYLSVEEAASKCKAHCTSSFSSSSSADAADDALPIVVADYADNPGGGAFGDSTALLASLLEAEVSDACYGPLVDTEAVAFIFAQAQQLLEKQQQQQQQGRSGSEQLSDVVPFNIDSLALGGKMDPRFGGGPLQLACTVKHISQRGEYTGTGEMIGGLVRSWGPCAVIQVKEIEVLVVSVRAQMLDLSQFSTFGIDPCVKKVVALKSMQHFRAAFEPVAAEVIICDSGALCTMDYARLPYTNIPRPLFPFDKDLDLHKWLPNNNNGVYIPSLLKK